MIGALVFGTLSDRIGRKKTLMLATCVFSVGTLLAYFSHSIQSLIPIRIFTGFGIGGAVPCAITLTSEYSPLKGRGKYVSIMYSGFLIGIVFGGYAAGAMLQHLNWRWLFVAGFLAPVLAIILVWLKLPESARWLSARDKDEIQKASLAKIIKKMQPGITIDANTQFVSAGAKKNRASIARAFQGQAGMGHADGLGVLSDKLHRSIFYRQLVSTVAGCQRIFPIRGRLYQRNRQHTHRSRVLTERFLLRQGRLPVGIDTPRDCSRVRVFPWRTCADRFCDTAFRKRILHQFRAHGRHDPCSYRLSVQLQEPGRRLGHSRSKDRSHDRAMDRRDSARNEIADGKAPGACVHPAAASCRPLLHSRPAVRCLFRSSICGENHGG